MRRKAISAELHAELTEYNSLLRALRTSHALDVTAHLVDPQITGRAPPNSQTVRNGSDEGLDNAGSTLPIAGPSSLDHPINIAIAKALPSPSQPNQRTRKQDENVLPAKASKGKRDTWTRWPLLADDVLTPEWSLDDEITILAKAALKRNPPHLTLPDLIADDEDEQPPDVENVLDDDDLDPPSYLPHLVSSVTTFLSSLLSLVAFHTPARPSSMQNRLEPVRWQSIINILAANGINQFVNAELLENAISRLEAIYGPASLMKGFRGRPATVEVRKRLAISAAPKEQLREQLRSVNESLFTAPVVRKAAVPTAPVKRDRRKNIMKAKKGKKSLVKPEADDDEYVDENTKTSKRKKLSTRPKRNTRRKTDTGKIVDEIEGL